jgi:transcriptional regulator with XRE-family HTH domain
LKEIRTLYGKSGYEIAKVLDISPQYYYELEREEKPIKAEYLFKLQSGGGKLERSWGLVRISDTMTYGIILPPFCLTWAKILK